MEEMSRTHSQEEAVLSESNHLSYKEEDKYSVSESENGEVSSRSSQDLAEGSNVSEKSVAVSSPEITFMKRDMPARATRGQRMNALMGAALDEDEDMWKKLGGISESEDITYSEESVADDLVDSDFDRPEDEEGEGQGEEFEEYEEGEGKKKRLGFLGSKKVIKKRKVVEFEEKHEGNITPQHPSHPLRRKLDEEGTEIQVERNMNVRRGTVAKTKETHNRFLKWEKRQIQKEKDKHEEKIETEAKPTQAEMMREAVLTEIINTRSLAYLQQLETIKKNLARGRINKDDGPFIKTISRFNADNQTIKTTIQFPSIDFYPKMFRQQEPQKAKKKKKRNNSITEEKAKYKDPLTGHSFTNCDSFKLLREKFFQKEEEKLGLRIQAINELLSVKKDKLKRQRLYRKQLNTHSGGINNTHNNHNEEQRIEDNKDQIANESE